MTEQSGKVLNIAHRGDSGAAPENTIAAFRRALAIGVDAIEMDLHTTRDREIVVIHDERVDRTTNGRGFIFDLSLAEARALDAGAWFRPPDTPTQAPPYAGERIPSLQEVLDLVRPFPVRLYLEIKHGPRHPPGVEAVLVDTLSRNAMDTRVVIESFDHTLLARVKRLNPALRTCALFEDETALPWATATSIGAEEVAPLWTLASREFIDTAHRAGLRVIVWTVDAEAAQREMMARGVDGIITNYPSRLKQIVDNL